MNKINFNKGIVFVVVAVALLQIVLANNYIDQTPFEDYATVEEGEWNYYSSLNMTNITTYISVIRVDNLYNNGYGDVDIYVTTDGTIPTKQNYECSSTTVGLWSEFCSIYSDGPVIVGIYGKKTSDYRIGVH